MMMMITITVRVRVRFSRRGKRVFEGSPSGGLRRRRVHSDHCGRPRAATAVVVFVATIIVGRLVFIRVCRAVKGRGKGKGGPRRLRR